MSLYLEEYSSQNQNLIERFIIFGLFFFHFLPITNITIRFILLLLLLFSCLFYKSFHQVNYIKSLSFISLITIFLIFYHGIAEGKDYFIYCYGILATSFLARKFIFSSEIIYKYFLYVIVPLGLFNLRLYNNVYYLPFTTGRVNIIGNIATKHDTAIIGTMLFVGAAYNILRTKKYMINKNIIFLLIGCYLVAFSGSRSCLLALIATVFLYIINKYRYKKYITILYFFIMISSVFFMEYVKDYTYLIQNDFILDLIGAENFKNHGVTTGRSWLWDYHWDSFINSSYLLGAGRTATDFTLGDYIPLLRIKAPAACESPYTGMLACNGIFGIFQLSILVFLSCIAIKKEKLLATCIIFLCIYNATMGVDFTNVLQAYPILLYLLYFKTLYSEK